MTLSRLHIVGAGVAALLAAVLTLTLVASHATALAAADATATPQAARDHATWRPARRPGTATWQGRLTASAPLTHLEVETGAKGRRTSQRVRVQVSSDGRRFRTVRTVRLTSGGRQRIDLGGRRGTHVRLRAFGAWDVWLNQVR
ncbi:MAG: hypothetical protein ACSLFR_04315, partial [Solirubrobacteraceae bacterium]